MLLTDLPYDLFENILCRIPVKFLKSLRCVSKSWHLIIDSDTFVQLHMSRPFATKHLILRSCNIFSVDMDNPDKANLREPPFNLRSFYRIHSCNGLVLVERERPVLWNPSSNEFKVLRGPRRSILGSNPLAKYGFSYDSRTNDYKIVRFLMQRNIHMHSWCQHWTEIYSLNSDSWKEIDNFPYPVPILNGTWGVHVEGVLHTLVQENQYFPARIMGFDVGTEEHHQVEMPSCIGSYRDMNLDTISGCLSLVCIYNDHVVIWVMKVYGSKKPWTRMMSINQPATRPYDTVKLLLYSKDCRRVLLNCNEHSLVWYDVEEETKVEELSVRCLPYQFYAVPCVESLFSFRNIKRVARIRCACNECEAKYVNGLKSRPHATVCWVKLMLQNSDDFGK